MRGKAAVRGCGNGFVLWCSARSHILAQLAASGVEPDRVDLLPLAAANSDHLATYSLMDISLDPFPYAGTTTTCESLYMGVPVITLAGPPHPFSQVRSETVLLCCHTAGVPHFQPGIKHRQGNMPLPFQESRASCVLKLCRQVPCPQRRGVPPDCAGHAERLGGAL
jgi:hypothetical protein